MTAYKTLATILALVGLSLTTQAQDAPPREAPKPAAKAPAQEKVKRAETRRRQLLQRRVGLSEDKVKRVEAIVKQHAEQQRALKQNVRKARVELRQLLRAESNDQAAYARALKELETAHRSLQDLRQKRFDGLKQTLTPKEQAQLLTTLGKVRRELRGAQPPPRERPRRRLRVQPEPKLEEF